MTINDDEIIVATPPGVKDRGTNGGIKDPVGAGSDKLWATEECAE
jgi:hypothetical protein